MFGKLAVAIVIGVLALYGLFEAYPLLRGPTITLATPLDGETIPNGVVTIQGTVARTTALTLNGAPLLPDEKGAFSSTLAYPKGTSILTLAARDRFGRVITTTRTIYIP